MLHHARGTQDMRVHLAPCKQVRSEMHAFLLVHRKVSTECCTDKAITRPSSVQAGVAPGYHRRESVKATFMGVAALVSALPSRRSSARRNIALISRTAVRCLLNTLCASSFWTNARCTTDTCARQQASLARLRAHMHIYFECGHPPSLFGARRRAGPITETSQPPPPTLPQSHITHEQRPPISRCERAWWRPEMRTFRSASAGSMTSRSTR